MRIVVGALFCAVAACASTSKQPQTAANAGAGSGSGSDVVCHEVTDTGSLFSHTECQPRDQEQVERDDAQRYMKTPRATLSPAGSHQ